MRNLEGEGDKLKVDFLYKSHVDKSIIQHKDEFDSKIKVEELYWPI